MDNLSDETELAAAIVNTKNLIVLFVALILHFGFTSTAFAVPETSGVRVTDVTTSSFSVVWMTDVAAEPAVEVYSNSSMTNQLTGSLSITAMPAGSPQIAQAARDKGIMKVRVSGLSPSTKYYVRTVTKDPLNAQSIGYSPVSEVVTASKAAPYGYDSGGPYAFSNDLLSFRTYIRPSDIAPEAGLGDLIILELEGSVYPISAFVGDGINSPEGLLDLNNVFGLDSSSLEIKGNEKAVFRIYRSDGPSALTHYRWAPQNVNMVYVVGPVKGFFADINLDGKVDDEDFAEFKQHYRTLPEDADYNPDFDFVEDAEGRIDAREFSKFSREYGRTDVQ